MVTTGDSLYPWELYNYLYDDSGEFVFTILLPLND